MKISPFIVEIATWFLEGCTAIAVIWEPCSKLSTLSFLEKMSWILTVWSHEPVMRLLLVKAMLERGP